MLSSESSPYDILVSHMIAKGIDRCNEPEIDQYFVENPNLVASQTVIECANLFTQQMHDAIVEFLVEKNINPMEFGEWVKRNFYQFESVGSKHIEGLT